MCIGDPSTEVCYAYQMVTGVYPDIPGEMYAPDEQTAHEVAMLVREKVGVLVAWPEGNTLEEYWQLVAKNLQDKD